MWKCVAGREFFPSLPEGSEREDSHERCIFHSMSTSRPLPPLSSKDLRIIRQCLRAAVDGPFFPDWEFETLIGAEQSEIAELIERPDADLIPDRMLSAVTNVLVNLVGYPHQLQYTYGWGAYIDATPESVDSLAARIRTSGLRPTTIYVYLLDEGSPAWRPVESEHISSDLYRILSENPDPGTESWEFPEGDVVRCIERKDADGNVILVAVESVPPADHD